MAFDFRHATLENGLTVIAETSPDAHTAAVGFFVKTGARDEPRELMGVSHFLEHMAFKGTVHRSADAVNRDFDRIGASHNAFTTGELTAFHAHVLPEKVGEATGIIADILRPSLRQADFDEEKGVILEEIAMYDDNPFWRLWESANERYFGAHPLGHRVLGTRDTVSALTRDQMQDYFDRRYSASNTVVCAAGAVDFDRLVEDVRRCCGHWRSGEVGRTHPAFHPHEESVRVTMKQANRAYLAWLCPAPSVQDPRRYAAAMLAQVLGDSDGSRLYWALVEPGIAEEAQAQYDGHDGLGEFVAYAACAPEDADKVEAIVLKELERVQHDLSERELANARAKVSTAVAIAGERPEGRMRRLGSLWTYRGRYASLEDEIAEIERLGIDDLKHLAREFPLRPVLRAMVLPDSA
ncbi:MAG: insulinase family protein [Planctomycetes bacterium]|nr:insulinase family protein [Planctomycetota bacterium]